MTSLLPLPSIDDRPRGCFWKPNAAFVGDLAASLRGRRVLEIFAGNGLLAGLLAARGVQVHATSVLSGMDAHDAGLFHPVDDIDAETAVALFGESADVLLVCWPTVTPSVLKAARRWGTDKDIVFIGEMTDYSQNILGGCATDEFFEQIRIHHVFDSYRPPFRGEKAVVLRMKEDADVPL